MGAPELRVDWSKGTASFDGYALRYDVWYRVGGKWGWDELIVGGAASANTGDDVRLLVNHAGVPMARSTAGTMTLESDRTGLRVRAESLDLRNPTVQELASAAERGDLSQMSFAFRLGSDEWDADYERRRIFSFEELVDVAPVTYPASPTTSFTVGGAGARASKDADEVRTSSGQAVDVAWLLKLDEFVEDGRARAAASMSRLKYLTRKETVPMNATEARVRRVLS